MCFVCVLCCSGIQQHCAIITLISWKILLMMKYFGETSRQWLCHYILKPSKRSRLFFSVKKFIMNREIKYKQTEAKNRKLSHVEIHNIFVWSRLFGRKENIAPCTSQSSCFKLSNERLHHIKLFLYQCKYFQLDMCEVAQWSRGMMPSSGAGDPGSSPGWAH